MASKDATGSVAASAFSRFPLQVLQHKKQHGERLCMMALYDAPSAATACEAGMDILLVGDSMGNVVLGYDTTIPVTLDDIAHHTAAVARGVRQSSRPRVPVIADLPFATYQGDPAQTVQNAARLMQAGAQGVKLEGAGESTCRGVERLQEAGIPVIGHLGFTPQSALQFSGVVQAKTAQSAHDLERDALRLQQAGCCAIVLEVVPLEVAARVTRVLQIPTIGIGAGQECDGQVLIWHDVMGISPHAPLRFVKRYAQLNQVLADAAAEFVREVQSGTFPATEHSWKMDEDELKQWRQQDGV